LKFRDSAKIIKGMQNTRKYGNRLGTAFIPFH
jgi:hypothetical protein